ncbi:RNase P subunit p30-domain-containing protein [Infundibulicybe gibba]|nr:RNase P subunit p30-domain-containing protein [Infundibulicybe gibba]
MFFDLCVPVRNPSLSLPGQNQPSKKGKGKPTLPNASAPVSLFTPAQVNVLEERVDLLVRLGYSVIAFTQTVHKKVESKSHVNFLEGLLATLRKRPGIVFLKRLNIILDHDSEKGFGLINANTLLFNGYDLIGLIPTNQATFSLACLTHSLPSPLTAHIITLPLTLPRLSFHLKHTLVRTALKNGAVFEIPYVGALGGENDAALSDAGAAESGSGAKRNWWAASKELVRVTKGKGLIVGGGVVAEADCRAPRDVVNLISLLGLAQDKANHTLTTTCKSVTLRAQTRQTYRTVLSNPRLIIPPTISTDLTTTETVPDSQDMLADDTAQPKKRARDALDLPVPNTAGDTKAEMNTGGAGEKGRSSRKKKRKMIKDSAELFTEM